MKSAPVSVCIPVYNGAAFLRECLDSVFHQTHAALEVVVVDDCSTDESASIVAEYRSRHVSLRYFRNDRNLGLVGNWNRCVELAAHDWIKFVFQDDTIAPTCIERLMEHASDPPALITCRRDFIFDESVTEAFREIYLHNRKRIDAFFAGGDHLSPLECQRAALERFGSNMFGEPTTVMLHRSFFDRFGWFREGMINSCDLEYWVRVSIHTGAYYVAESLAHFRVHGAAMSAQNHKLREFRKELLDNLLLIHDFATEPVYEPLRVHGRHRLLPIDVAEGFRTMLHRTYAKADWARRDRDNPNSLAMKELTSFYREFPELKVNRVAHLYWRLKTRLANREGSHLSLTK